MLLKLHIDQAVFAEPLAHIFDSTSNGGMFQPIAILLINILRHVSANSDYMFKRVQHCSAQHVLLHEHVLHFQLKKI